MPPALFAKLAARDSLAGTNREFTAAASETKADAREDAQWRQRILDWYSKSGRAQLPVVGRTPPNVYGVHDMHGVVWEWVEDLASMLVSADNREQGDPDLTRFCGTGALSMEQKENYAMLHADRDALEHAGELYVEHDGVPLRSGRSAAAMKSAACFCLLLTVSFVGAAPTDPPGSLYHLNVSLQNQRGEDQASMSHADIRCWSRCSTVVVPQLVH